MLDTISTAKMSREEWLEERRKSIGGSDAAAVIGMSRFASPYTVWMDKTGRLPEKEDTEAMRIGRDLEEYVAKRFEEASGKRCGAATTSFGIPRIRGRTQTLTGEFPAKMQGWSVRQHRRLTFDSSTAWSSRNATMHSVCIIWPSPA